MDPRAHLHDEGRGGVTHPTHNKGRDPDVIVIHEIPGMIPEVIAADGVGDRVEPGGLPGLGQCPAADQRHRGRGGGHQHPVGPAAAAQVRGQVIVIVAKSPR